VGLLPKAGSVCAGSIPAGGKCLLASCVSCLHQWLSLPLLTAMHTWIAPYTQSLPTEEPAALLLWFNPCQRQAGVGTRACYAACL
jgi:hypothetical protein